MINRNIFSLLQYPITEEFLPEDLARLPKHVLADWWHEITIIPEVAPLFINTSLIEGVRDRIDENPEYASTIISALVRRDQCKPCRYLMYSMLIFQIEKEFA